MGGGRLIERYQRDTAREEETVRGRVILEVSGEGCICARRTVSRARSYWRLFSQSALPDVDRQCVTLPMPRFGGVPFAALRAAAFAFSEPELQLAASRTGSRKFFECFFEWRTT